MKKRFAIYRLGLPAFLAVLLLACSLVQAPLADEPTTANETVAGSDNRPVDNTDDSEVDDDLASPAGTDDAPPPVGMDDQPQMDGGMAPPAGMDGRTQMDDDAPPHDQPSDDSPAAERAIHLLATHEPVAAFLANYPDWQADAYPEDSDDPERATRWWIDFYSESVDEWLGYGYVDLAGAEILEYFVPAELTPEAYADGLVWAEEIVFADAEVQARLGDIANWEYELDYDRWEQAWVAWFWQGLDELGVYVYPDEMSYYLEIYDPAALDEAEARRLARDQAIELAYEAPDLDAALAGVDDWVTYVEHQGGTIYAVSFAAGDSSLFFALVDIESWQILETG